MNEVVTQDFVTRQEAIQLACAGLASGQKPDPDRGIHENHGLALRLFDDGRRRGTGFAPGSELLKARRRSYAACRMSASRPRRTASVSVEAALAARASLRRVSSICSVFFIHIILPYAYIYFNHID